MSIEASTIHLAKVRNFAAEHAIACGFGKQAVADIQLAIDEAFTNIIKHAYNHNKQGSVNITLGCSPHEFRITLFDTGNAFAPGEYSDPNIHQLIREGRGGGVGVYLIKKLMDEVQYQSDGSVNEIYMIKKK